MGDYAQLQRVHAQNDEEGCREFRLDEHDIERVEIVLQDYTGRMLVKSVHRSAVLLMVPMPGSIGAIVFEPVLPALRHENRPIWIQRVVLGQHEIYDMIAKHRQQQQKPALIEFPGGRRG